MQKADITFLHRPPQLAPYFKNFKLQKLDQIKILFSLSFKFSFNRYSWCMWKWISKAGN